MVQRARYLLQRAAPFILNLLKSFEAESAVYLERIFQRKSETIAADKTQTGDSSGSPFHKEKLWLDQGR